MHLIEKMIYRYLKSRHGGFDYVDPEGNRFVIRLFTERYYHEHLSKKNLAWIDHSQQKGE